MGICIKKMREMYFDPYFRPILAECIVSTNIFRPLQRLQSTGRAKHPQIARYMGPIWRRQDPFLPHEPCYLGSLSEIQPSAPGHGPKAMWRCARNKPFSHTPSQPPMLHICIGEYCPVTMIVADSGHQVRCIPWVQMGTFNKEIGFLCGL